MTHQQLGQFNGVLIDTNLLILLVIGQLHPDLIADFKRTKGAYTAQDYPILLSFVNRFRLVVTTPNILTEASNLLEGYAYKGVSALTWLSALANRMEERYSLSTNAMRTATYLKFGLSDAVIGQLATDNVLVLTDDLNFCAYLHSQQLAAFNFNHLRGYLLR